MHYALCTMRLVNRTDAPTNADPLSSRAKFDKCVDGCSNSAVLTLGTAEYVKVTEECVRSHLARRHGGGVRHRDPRHRRRLALADGAVLDGNIASFIGFAPAEEPWINEKKSWNTGERTLRLTGRADGLPRVSGRRDYHPKLTCVWFRAREIAKGRFCRGRVASHPF